MRWTTPVIQFCRTAMRDVEIRGQQIRAGQALCLFYPSANRDEDVFDDAVRASASIAARTRTSPSASASTSASARTSRASSCASCSASWRGGSSAPSSPAPVERLRSSFLGGVKHMPIRYRLAPRVVSEHVGAADAAAPQGAAVATDAYEPPLTDWTLRPFAAAHRSPWLVAAALALAFAALSQAGRLAIGEGNQVWRNDFAWLDLLNGVLFAYVPTAMWLLRRARLRDLRELRPQLREGVSYPAVVDAVLRVPPRRLFFAGIAGACAIGALPTIDPGFWDGPMPPLLHPFMIFFVARMAVIGCLGGRAIASEATTISAFSQLGATQTRVDLLDLRPFEVFARTGLRSALVWVLISSLVSLFWLGPGAGTANGFIVGAILVGVTWGLYVYIHGPHLAIAAAKSDALGTVEARIARAGAALMEGRSASANEPRLADLIAWHGFLARVREWPLDAPALLRGALIAALGLGSWLGGALVDRALDRWFG